MYCPIQIDAAKLLSLHPRTTTQRRPARAAGIGSGRTLRVHRTQGGTTADNIIRWFTFCSAGNAGGCGIANICMGGAGTSVGCLRWGFE